MTGMIRWKEPQQKKRGKAVCIQEKTVLRVPFLCAEIVKKAGTPEAVVHSRVAAACKKLHKRGCTQVVLPENFPYAGSLGKWGLCQVSTCALRQTLAAELTKAALAERGYGALSAKIAVSAAQLSADVVRAVTELCLHHRYVWLDHVYGADTLYRQLRREYGISLLLNPEKRQLEEADALVLFHERDDLSGNNTIVLPLYDDSAPLPPLLVPSAMEERLPRDVSRPHLLAALQASGAFRPGQIIVGAVGEIPGKMA